MNTHINAPEMRPPIAANLQTTPTDAECFVAIDAWVREKEREWAVIARACLEVQTRELWKCGDYHSWDAWLNNAAPRSARTIYWHISLLKGLEPDFTDAELSHIAPEAAKVLRSLPKSVRNDPRVREAAKGKRQALVAKLRETHPGQLMENSYYWAADLSESQFSKVDACFALYKLREGDEQVNRADFLEDLCQRYVEEKI